MSITLSINMAMTLDGKVSRPDGKWYGLCSENDRRQMDVLRAEADALILGKNSIINDDPVIRLKYFSGKDPQPVLIVRSGIIPRNRKLFQDTDNKPIVFCTELNHSVLVAELGELAEIIILGKTDVVPVQVLETLETKGFKNILLEGGPRLNHSFMYENLINKINLTVVPYLVGQRNLPAIVDGDYPFLNFDKNKWRLKSCKQIDNEIFLVYEK